MFKYRGGRKRELSIYSILTIIVLISISGGCAPRGQTVGGFHAKDAALILIADRLSEGKRAIQGEGDKRIKQIDSKIWGVKIDGELVHGWYQEVLTEVSKTSTHGWAEILPGHHKISIIICFDSNAALEKIFEDPHPLIPNEPMGIITIEYDVKPHGVLVLHGEITPQGQYRGWITESPASYDQTTGIARNPRPLGGTLFGKEWGYTLISD